MQYKESRPERRAEKDGRASDYENGRGRDGRRPGEPVFMRTIERGLQHGDVGILYERNDRPRSPFVELYSVPDGPDEGGYEFIDTADPRSVWALVQGHLRSCTTCTRPLIRGGDVEVPFTTSGHAFVLPEGLPDGRAYTDTYNGEGVFGLYIRLRPGVESNPIEADWCGRDAAIVANPPRSMTCPDDLRVAYGSPAGTSCLNVRSNPTLAETCFVDMVYLSGCVERIGHNELHVMSAQHHHEGRSFAPLAEYAPPDPDRLIVDPGMEEHDEPGLFLERQYGRRAGFMTIDRTHERLSQVLAAQFLAHGRSVAGVSLSEDLPRTDCFPKLSPDRHDPDRGELSLHRDVEEAVNELGRDNEPSLLVARAYDPPNRSMLMPALMDPTLMVIVAAGYSPPVYSYDQYRTAHPPVFDAADLAVFRQTDHYILRVNSAPDSQPTFVPAAPGPVNDLTLQRAPLPAERPHGS